MKFEYNTVVVELHIAARQVDDNWNYFMLEVRWCNLTPFYHVGQETFRTPVFPA